MSGRPLSPGEYWYEDVEPGDHWRTGGMVVTESHIVAFAGLSGDFFDVHMDDAFARSQGFPGRVAHGLLGLALVDGLKNRAPARILAVASLGWNWRFQGPVFAGDRISAAISVHSKRLTSAGDRGVVTLDFNVTKQDDVVVQSGQTILLARLRPAS
ncbi:MAG TPA: MaoC/PaaZ C-terminal domain-containing protein [Geminicoccus sp.]|jgi:acyl dehydratase|uniref:MaoC family dehydratase n=1 Tax=Geminicoccus sp. TaxID=2024832 RepID=UPI002E3761AD|nr:MaoC/PaaZ C-terminal domain-containing protein [Geminicoccus sp.]HEX2527072.1 MaoC/PaaZ C-terminal domain-containing protein [Geminicoccus sp.]